MSTQPAAMTPLLEVRDVYKHFSLSEGLFSRGQTVHAVDGVDLQIGRRESVGLVGESGCGKTTLGRLIVRLERPTRGKILYEGEDIWGTGDSVATRLPTHMQMIFQDFSTSLNPRKRVRDTLRVPLLINKMADRQTVDGKVEALLREVGLEPEIAQRYPVQLSGGQQQRVTIARAISVEPNVLVADEAVSSLDVSVQAQVIRLLERIQDERGLSLLYISHDLAVVRYLCGRVAVMYLGKIVESAPVQSLFERPRHPYTVALLSAVPSIRQTDRQRIILSGEVASATQIPEGCRFVRRCWKAQGICHEVEPSLEGNGEWPVACHFPEH